MIDLWSHFDAVYKRIHFMSQTNLDKIAESANNPIVYLFLRHSNYLYDYYE